MDREHSIYAIREQVNLVERTWNDDLRAMPELNDRRPNSQEFAWLIGIGGTRPRQCVVETLIAALDSVATKRAPHTKECTDESNTVSRNPIAARPSLHWELGQRDGPTRSLVCNFFRQIAL